MAEDSHPNGGRRSQTRHNIENMGGFGIVWLILNRIEGLSSAEQTVALGVGMAALSGALKFWNENGIGKRLLKKLGLSSIVLLLLTGCGISIGHVTPSEFEGENGQTIIACEMKGIQLGFGDGGVCQNAEGGHVSNTFAVLFTGTIEAVGRILGAVLSPFGAAGAALQSAPAVTLPPPPARGVPGIVQPPSVSDPAPASSFFD